MIVDALRTIFAESASLFDSVSCAAASAAIPSFPARSFFTKSVIFPNSAYDSHAPSVFVLLM